MFSARIRKKYKYNIVFNGLLRKYFFLFREFFGTDDPFADFGMFGQGKGHSLFHCLLYKNMISII